MGIRSIHNAAKLQKASSNSSAGKTKPSGTTSSEEGLSTGGKPTTPKSSSNSARSGVNENNSATRNSGAPKSAAARRAYLNKKFGRTGNLHADINARSGIYPPKEGFVYRQLDQLQPGMKIDRYGGFIDDAGNFQDYGAYLSPKGVPFPQRALPLSSLQKPYSVYEVLKPFNVQSGPIAPWFNQPGGGIQYKLLNKANVNSLIKDGFIKAIN